MKGERIMPKFSITKPVYTLASMDGQDAELTMYGQIYESRPTDWWGDPIDGQFILLDEVLADLERVSGCRTLTVRINSYGGDAGASNTIHNRLRELSREGTKTVCIVDGAAMSGGSLIMCACDTVKVNPSSLIMIHKCWTLIWGGYNADELRAAAKENDAFDKMQVEIYKRKTGLSETVLLHMMSDTTYMTGREAKEKGFADEIIEDAEPAGIAASADGRSFYVRGKKFHLTAGMFMPDSVPTANEETEVNPGEATTAPVATIEQPEVTGREGGNSMTMEELRATYPELVEQIENAARASVNTEEIAASAVQGERNRLSGIDAVAHLFDANLVREARYGENACTAQELCYRAAQRAAQQGQNFLAALDADNAASGAGNVNAAPAKEQDKEEETPEARQAAVDKMVSELFKKEGK